MCTIRCQKVLCILKGFQEVRMVFYKAVRKYIVTRRLSGSTWQRVLRTLTGIEEEEAEDGFPP